MARLILDEILKKKRISKREFSRRLGVDYKNISRMFRKGFDPRVSALAKYAKALDVSCRDLLKD
jgi:transcriptional regulator with XRE-family HTH domain